MRTRPSTDVSSPAADGTASVAAVARRPRVQLHDSAPESALSDTPAVRGTAANRLARAVGTEATTDEAGNATVELPAPGEPGAPFSTAPRTVTRALQEDGAPAPAQPSTGAEQHGSAPPAEGATGAPEVDMDEITETVIERLRRELLIEREQSGGSMDLI